MEGLDAPTDDASATKPGSVSLLKRYCHPIQSFLDLPRSGEHFAIAGNRWRVGGAHMVMHASLATKTPPVWAIYASESILLENG